MFGEVNKWSGGEKKEKTWAGTKYIRPFSHQHSGVSLHRKHNSSVGSSHHKS